ncbi:CPBP family intramembrane glutamic endopeptidase [Nocardia sp. NPDC101769]|uniref:CPBP family intramembrane glutamic endopeptidase n=1 Tax=Nocardia sp. NPDC101769 TaxID=3364333 RepID=UPI00382E2020
MNKVGLTGRLRSVPARVAVFFVIAWLLSWAWLVPMVVRGATIRAGAGWPTHFPSLIGPAVSAIVVTGVYEGRAGLWELKRRALSWRVRPIWWLVSVSPLVVACVALIVEAMLGRSIPALRDFAAVSGLPSSWGIAGVGLVMLMVGGFGEELGWRGYAQPVAQQRWQPLIATVLVAAGWAVWHWPMFFVLDSFRAFSVVGLAGWGVGLFCGAVVLAWLYNRSGSVVMVAVWHAGFTIVTGSRAADGVLAASISAVVMVVAIALVAGELRAIVTGAATVIGPPRTAQESFATADGAHE